VTLPAQPPTLLLDFDNTITCGDVLDLVIERYSATDQWRRWEVDWQDERISTRECLARQTDDLRVTLGELIRFTDEVRIDDAFESLICWAAAHDIETSIASDNFDVVIEAMLRRRGLPSVPVYANRLTFRGDRPHASFPFQDPSCDRCANCKAQHLRGAAGRTRIFVGDGLSDICPAKVADVVFAKDSLAVYLESIGRPYRLFRSLADVLEVLQITYGHVTHPASTAQSARR
jgi:2,3-diketo-5-methylthio-1-phosphopentane phosphatase